MDDSDENIENYISFLLIKLSALKASKENIIEIAEM